MNEEPLLKKSPKRILIPRFDTIGDIILLEGFLEALLEKYPDAEIVIVVQKVFYQLKSLFPKRVKWLSTKAHPYNLESNLDEVNLLLNQLADKHWDLVLTTTFNRTYIDDIIALKLKDVWNIAIGNEKEIPWYFKHMWQKLGLNGDSPNYKFVPIAESLHETEKYRILWNSLTGKDRGIPQPRLIISDNLKEKAKLILSNLGLRKKGFYICAPAGIKNVGIKTWPEERFADVITRLEREYNLRTLLIGQKRERRKIEKVASLVKERGKVPFIWLGKNGEIPILAAIIQKAKFYFGNDTGPMHLAAAVEIPVVGIFGGGHWPRFLPTGSHSIGIAGDLPCFGCEWDCIFADAPCVRLVSVDDAKSAIKNVIQGEGLDSNMVRSSYKVSNETARYIEKAVNKYKSIKSELTAKLDRSELDCAARLEVINDLQKRYEESEADRAARLEVINDLQKRYEESEADRAEKLEEIKRQLEELDQLHSCLESIKSSRSWRMTAPFRKFLGVWKR